MSNNKLIDDLACLKGHLHKHLENIQEVRDCLVYRSKADKENMDEIVKILSMVVSSIEDADNIREVSKVIDIGIMEDRFDYVMGELASVPGVQSDIIDKIVEIEEGEE